MIYLKVQENEYPAYISGRLIDRDWDGRASKSITLTMTHAQAAQLLSLIHISEPTRQAEISYAVFCLKKKKKTKNITYARIT